MMADKLTELWRLASVRSERLRKKKRFEKDLRRNQKLWQKMEDFTERIVEAIRPLCIVWRSTK